MILPPSYISVPAGMSYVNAFMALYLYRKSPFDQIYLMSKLNIDVIEKIFRNTIPLFDGTPSFFIGTAFKEPINVGFGRFDSHRILEVSQYDFQYGKGSGKFALEAYNTVLPFLRFDTCDRCKFSVFKEESKK